MAATAQPCPQCGHELPVDERLSTWCDRCEWNLQPVPPDPPKGRLARTYAVAGQRLGARLVRELTKAESLEPRLTANLVAAYAIALAVHALTLALGIGAVAVLILGFPNPFAFVGAVLFGGIAALMRPRLGTLGDDDLGHYVDAASAPHLHALVEAVAAALETPAPRRIRIDHEFNAAWFVAGLRRERVLSLGLPLLHALDARERVALVAHELGHARNGDARRGLVIGSALGAMLALLELLEPDRGESSPTAWQWGPVGSLVDAFLWLLARPLELLLWVEFSLLMRDTQRAEFLADHLAARVAGTRAVVTLHEKLLLGPVWEAVARDAAVRRDEDDVFERLRAALEDVPERERERRRRVARLDDIRLDITHPPTPVRIDLLLARPAQPPAVTLAQQRSERIDDELRPLRPQLAAAALDASAGALYAG